MWLNWSSKWLLADRYVTWRRSYNSLHLLRRSVLVQSFALRMLQWTPELPKAHGLRVIRTPVKDLPPILGRHNSLSKTFEDHVEQLSQVLSRIGEAGLKVVPKKCHFFQSEVMFLGNIVSKVGVATDPSKTHCIADWPQPKTVKEVRQFTGLCAYYRRHAQNLSEIARPLHKLTEKGRPFLWTEECSKAFNELKRMLTSSPILAYPIPGLDYLLDSDASAEALRSVLSQVQDGHERVMCYYCSYYRQERNYCVTMRELLAIVDSVKHFHPYLMALNA